VRKQFLITSLAVELVNVVFNVVVFSEKR